jgi:hypothetical protein
MKALLSYLEMQQMWENYNTLMPRVGDQTHHNHDKCEAGTDTKQRLYLKRTPEGMVAFCHHCGKGGFLRTERKPARVEMLLEEKLASPMGKNPFLRENARGWEEWPSEVKLWWMSHEMTQQDALDYDVTWDVFTCRLVLSGTTMIQGRAFGGMKPKYLSHKFVDDVEHWPQAEVPTTLFVCEDLMSGFKLHKAKADVLCLTGTKVNYKHLTVCSRYAKVLVWLDRDVAGEWGAVKLFKSLSGITTALLHPSKCEPKETPFTELQALVRAYARH